MEIRNKCDHRKEQNQAQVSSLEILTVLAARLGSWSWCCRALCGQISVTMSPKLGNMFYAFESLDSFSLHYESTTKRGKRVHRACCSITINYADSSVILIKIPRPIINNATIQDSNWNGIFFSQFFPCSFLRIECSPFPRWAKQFESFRRFVIPTSEFLHESNTRTSLSDLSSTNTCTRAFFHVEEIFIVV